MKSLKFSSFVFAIFGVLVLCLSLFVSAPVAVNAAEENTSSSVAVTALNSNGQSLPNTGSYNLTIDNRRSDLYAFNWSAVNKFKVSFNLSDIPETWKGDDGKYRYSIRIEYVNEYTDAMEEANATFEANSKIQSITDMTSSTADVSLIQDVEYSVASLKDRINAQNEENRTFDINSGSPVTTQKECFGWGIYRFSIVFSVGTQSQTFSSAFFSLEPSTLQGAPTIDKKYASSQTGLINAFNCFLTNDNIDYIDINTIKWFVQGITTDGKKYVLTQEDINDEYPNFIHPTVERTGTSFYFDSNKLAGKWEVYCVYTPHKATVDQVKQSNVLEVSTGNRLAPSTILWWILAAVALLIIIVVIVIVVTKKKEKVW